MFDHRLWMSFPSSLKKIGVVSLSLVCHLPVLAEQLNMQPVWQTESLPPVSEGAFMNARLIAKDETDDLQYKIIEAPAWLKLTERGIMTYRPDFLAAGKHVVMAQVSDGEHQVNKTWEIRVRDVNQRPELHNSPAKTVSEGEVFRFTPEVTDLDKESMTLRLENAPQGMVLHNDKIMWETDYQAAGHYEYQLLFNDGRTVVTHSFDLTVENVNQKPNWAGFTFSGGKENTPLQQTLKAQDLDQDRLTYRLIQAPDGAIIQAGVFEWLPSFDAAGKHVVHIAVSDGVATVILKTELTIDNTNRLPHFMQQTLMFAQEDSAYSYQFAAGDADGETLTFSLQHSPKGVSLASDGLLNWQPSYDDAGDHEVAITVSDGLDQVNASFSLHVENTNRAPQFQTLQLANAQESEDYQAVLSVVDPDGDLVSVQLISGPEGLWLTEQTLDWLPDYESAGEHEILVEVSDGDLATTQAFTLHVKNTNRLPVVSSEPVALASENSPYRYSLDFFDEDNDALTTVLTQSPKSMRLQDDVLVWTPDYHAAGSVDVEVKVSETKNPKAFVTQRFVIDVANTKRPPVWQTTLLASAKENSPLQIQLKATDADKQLIQYSVELPPEGLALDSSGLMTWTPHFEQSGNYELTFIADDGESSVPVTLSMEVMNTNRSPVITSLAPVEADEYSEYSYFLTTEDPDQDPLSLTLLASPKGFELIDGELRWTPNYHQAGKHKVRVQVTDGRLSAQQVFVINVQNTNREPVWQVPEATQLTLSENKSWSLALKASDADAQSVSYQLLTTEDGLRLQGKTLHWKPSFSQAGHYSITVAASDGESTVEQIIDLDVANINMPPRITSTAVKRGKEDAAYRYDLSAKDPDFEDQDALTYRLVKAPEGMTILDQTITWFPGYESAGVHQIVVEVADNEATELQSFGIQVANTNRAPEFISEPVLSVEENTDYQYEISVVDFDGQAVRLTLVDAPKGLRLAGSKVSYSPSFKDAGVYPVVLSVTDGQLVTEQRFDIRVDNVNRDPVMTSAQSLQAYEGVDYQYRYNATDEDGEKLSFSLLDSPVGMRLIDGAIQWHPSYGQSGEHRVKLAVTDQIETIFQTFTLKVDNTNREPAFTQIHDQKIRAAKKWQLPLLAKDVDGETVSFRLIHAPEGMSITEDNHLYWKPKKDALGQYTVIVAVTDGDLKVRQHFEVQVSR